MKLKSILLAFAVISLFVRCQTVLSSSQDKDKPDNLATFVPTDSLMQPSASNETAVAPTMAYINEPPKHSVIHSSQNATPSRLNRDVPSVLSTPKMVETVIPDVPIDVALLYKGLSPKSQEFDLQGSEVLRLNCQGGTVIMVHPHAFEYEDGTPVPHNTRVTLKVTEYVKRGDMLSAPLTTLTDDGQTLESGGMAYTYAFANSKRCRLKADSMMQVGFKMVDDENFQLFDGKNNSSNLVQWALAPQPQPVSVITHNNVDKRPQFAYGRLEDYIVRNMYRTKAMKSYNGEGFDICAIVTVNKQGKVVAQRLTENKDFFSDMGIDTAFKGMIQRMPLWLPAMKKGKPVRSRAMITINFSGFRDESANLKLASSEHFAQTMRSTVDDMLASMDDDLLTFPVKHLGWINCDRFYGDPRPKANLVVDAGVQNADVKLIFKKLNAIMGTSRMQNRQFQSSNIPVGEPVYVVGIRKENDQLYFGMEETTADNKTIALNFSPVSEDELRVKMKAFNQ
jgi:hypothetical protein